tara:strand:- start:39 stop:998 length:960 start_codon:yes stop_codon:yes gene_type:complete
MKKIFLNNLLIILIFFILFEILLRTFNLADLRGHGAGLTNGKKNIETIVFGKKVYIDSYGYRVPKNNFLYKNEKKIVFIGDSVLFGSGVKEEETFVGKLRKSNLNISFINSSFVGNDISKFLNNIEINHEIFNANDFYIVLTLDDIIISNSERKNDVLVNNPNKESLFRKLKKNVFFAKINYFLRSRSYTYLWIKGVTTKPSERYFFESFEYYKNENEINNLNKEIEKISEASNLKNISVKFLILPYEYQVRKNCNKDFLQPQEVLIKVFIQNNIKYMNLTNSFCDYSGSKKLYLNFDPVHLSPEGHDLVYKEIKKKIK